MTIHIQGLAVGLLQSNCYVAHCDQTGETLIVDPGAEAERILALVEDRRVRYILLTHAHYDHIGALPEVRQATGAPILIHAAEASWLNDPQLNGSAMNPGVVGEIGGLEADRLLQDGDTIPFAGHEIQVLHTPGHTPGGVSFLMEDVVFAGDALFAGSIGRTDLPGGNMEDLLAGIRDKLLPLDPDTSVLPGHGPATTIAEEKAHNPFVLQFLRGAGE